MFQCIGFFVEHSKEDSIRKLINSKHDLIMDYFSVVLLIIATLISALNLCSNSGKFYKI
jgi:hypothetical protein